MMSLSENDNAHRGRVIPMYRRTGLVIEFEARRAEVPVNVPADTHGAEKASFQPTHEYKDHPVIEGFWCELR